MDSELLVVDPDSGRHGVPGEVASVPLRARDARPPRSRRPAFAVVLGFVLVVGACGGGSGASLGKGTPPFSARTLEGAQLSSASFKGKPVVLWFWAPWCTICRAEAPGIAKAVAEIGAKVEYVGVAGRGEVPAMKQFVEQTHTGTFTHVVDSDGSIWSAYGVAAQPAFAFIGADGQVSVSLGRLDHDALVARLRSLVAG